MPATSEQAIQRNLAHRRARYLSDAGHREAKKASDATRNRVRYQSDPTYRERKFVAQIEWRNGNRDQLHVQSHRRRARKNGASGSHSAEDVSDIRRMQRNCCAMPMCRKLLEDGGTVDHISPLAGGGSNDRANIQLLCRPCNSSKKAHDQATYLRRYGFLI